MSKLPPQKKEKFHWLRSWWSLLLATYNDWTEDPFASLRMTGLTGNASDVIHP